MGLGQPASVGPKKKLNASTPVPVPSQIYLFRPSVTRVPELRVGAAELAVHPVRGHDQVSVGQVGLAGDLALVADVHPEPAARVARMSTNVWRLTP